MQGENKMAVSATHAHADAPLTLVTGASRGIGRALCVEMVSRGHHVIALARTVGALEELADEVGNDNITLIPQDLTDGQSLEALGPLLFEKFGKLDNFIGNAGMLGTLCPMAQTDPVQWQRVFAINVTANLHLIRTLDPLLRAAPKGKAVFITSNAATNPRAYWGAYAASKAALESMVRAYSQEVETAPLSISLFNPGRVATKMRAAAYPGEDPSTLDQPFNVARKIADTL